MVAAGLRIVVGDETLFLERLHPGTAEPKVKTTIQPVVKQLAPVVITPVTSATLPNASLDE